MMRGSVGKCLRFAITLANCKIAGPDGCPAKGSDDASRRISLPSQIMTSASNGSRRANSARIFMRATGFRMTKVPAAPMLTASKLSVFASTLGRNVLCPPTLTPLRRTTSAIVSTRGGQESLPPQYTIRKSASNCPPGFLPTRLPSRRSPSPARSRGAPTDMPACETAAAHRPSSAAARTQPRRRR